jgi:hypothetical protein
MHIREINKMLEYDLSKMKSAAQVRWLITYFGSAIIPSKLNILVA